MNNLSVFSGSSNPSLTNAICEYIGIPVGNGIVSHFPDGETMIKIDDDVRGKDCFIVQPTCSPVNNNLMELLIYIDCLKRSSAQSITVVAPYFGYARQDRKTEGRTPITAKMSADLITHVGANRILTVDLHAHQIEGFFNIPVDHLKAVPIFINHLRDFNLDNISILSPDIGNAKSANIYAEKMGIELAIIDKKRISGNEVVPLKLIGNVKDKNVLMFDDIISTAGTICSAAVMAKDYGAKSVSVYATHGLFTGQAYERLVESKIDNIYITDTIPLTKRIRDIKHPSIHVFSIAKLLGEAILRIHQRRSVSFLLSDEYENSLR